MGLSEDTFLRLMAHPIGMLIMTTAGSEVANPTGAGWYPIVVVKYRRLARTQDGTVHTSHVGAWCMEQILNGDDDGTLGWSLENLRPEQMSRRSD